MVESIIGQANAEDIFASAMLSRFVSEKQAEDMLGGIEKEAGFWDFLKELTGGFASAAKSAPSILGGTALLGGGLGVLGANLYDIVKEQVTHEDPKEKLNDDIEAMYEYKTRELEDSKWMRKIRGMRAELKRGVKTMPTDVYRKKWDELMAALEERS